MLTFHLKNCSWASLNPVITSHVCDVPPLTLCHHALHTKAQQG